MEKRKRIILVGPTAAGKSYISEQLQKAGYILDVSYTSRPIRSGEINGKDYIFLSKNEFIDKMINGDFFEDVEYDGNYYGTGLFEFEEGSDVFV